VKGTATNAKIVTVKVGKSAARAVTGSTASWHFTAKLKKGANLIVVTATNADGVASKPAKVTVLRK
jgi:hypothetical protein